MVDFFPPQLPRVPAVSQHGHAVGDLLHLRQPVRNVQNADAGALQIANHGEQPLGIARGEARSRLIHDEHTRAQAERAADLDQLLLPN